MTPFRYEIATGAVDAVSRAGRVDGAQFIAGGTSQVDLMKEGVQRPAVLVDIARIGLDEITDIDGGGLSIGANVRNSVASDHPAIQQRYPAIAEALHAGASQQIRNMASMAGNLLQRTRCLYLRDWAQHWNKRDTGSGCAAVDGFNRLHAVFGPAVHPGPVTLGAAALRAMGPQTCAAVLNAIMIRSRRSALYLPASNPRAVAKARTLPADVIILDLEDAVAPEAKDNARAAVIAAIVEGGFGDREIVVRVNGLQTPWGEADLEALASTPPQAVLIPKVASPGDLTAAAARAPRVPLWAMIEMPAAILHLGGIAAAPGLGALVMGCNDLAAELGATPGADRIPLHPALALTLAAARAHGLAALDGVFNAIEDEAGFAAEARQGAAFGFDGKTLIHPSQIDTCNAAFSPSPEQVANARAVVAAFDDPANAQLGAIRLDGRMVERLHLATAHRTLARA